MQASVLGQGEGGNTLDVLGRDLHLFAGMDALPSPHQSEAASAGKREWSAPRLERLAASLTQTGMGASTEIGNLGMCPFGATATGKANSNCS